MAKRFEDLLRSVRHLRKNGETLESLRAKNDEEIAVQLDLLGIENIDNEFINSVKKSFEYSILFNPS